MFSGFQSNAFQINAFQIIPLSSAPAARSDPNGNRNREYTPTYYELENTRKKLQKYKDEEREAQIELLSVQYKIEDLELKRLHDLSDEVMQLELLALLKEQQVLQFLLKELQIQKDKLRREDDELLILLMSQPFFT